MTDKEREEREERDAAAAARRSLAPGALVAVTFLEMYAPYNAGETAGVDRDLAERLVKAGKAVYHGERREDGRPAFDGDQAVDLAVAPNHPMRSPSQLAEQQFPATHPAAVGQVPATHPLDATGAVAAQAPMDTSSGRDMTGTVVEDKDTRIEPKGSGKSKR